MRAASPAAGPPSAETPLMQQYRDVNKRAKQIAADRGDSEKSEHKQAERKR